jgi:hypothetical protein
MLGSEDKPIPSVPNIVNIFHQVWYYLSLRVSESMSERSSFRQHPLYKMIIWAALIASLVLLWKMNDRILSNPEYIPVDDFSHYWAAGRLNTTGQDPYDPLLIQKERDALLDTPTDYDTVPIMWTPPWSLPFVMPFGVLDYPFSRLLWLVVNVTILLVCANLTWKIYNGRPKNLFWAWIIIFTFGPTISVLEKGQITPIVLLGIIIFLYFQSRQGSIFIIGAAVVMAAVKPQIAYLFWPALLYWIIRYRRWNILHATVVIALSATGIAWAFNPDVISEYTQAVVTVTPTDWATPTIGGYLRLIFGIDRFWLQFLPPVFGFVWLLLHLHKRNWDWDWLTDTPPMLIISILTAPYAWTYDHVVLLPAILMAWIALDKVNESKSMLVFGATLFAISLLDLWLHRYFGEFWFGWLAPAWLVWYYGIQSYIKMHSSRNIQQYAA